MNIEIEHPNDNRLIFSAIHYPAEKREGEWNYSLGSPPIPESYEITAVAFNNGEETVDITDFVSEWCDHLFAKWEKDLAGK